MKNRTYHPRGASQDGYSPVRTHPNYATWAGLKRRCSNDKEPAYKNYGGRGISYCKEWEHFGNFCKDMGVRPGPEYTIDRIDNNGNYCAENCRWATRTEQCLNRRVFLNNSTGATGVVKRRGRYEVRYDEGCVRRHLGGSFATLGEAAFARTLLVKKLGAGDDVSSLLERPARYDSTTGVRGISRHPDGGFTVRTTVGGARKYLGYFKTIEEAERELLTWKKKN